jgi:hypothetical protein
MNLRYPDFLGIGAQKAGTTWLHLNLRRHPGVWLPPVKELQYFNEIYVTRHRRWMEPYRKKHGVRALTHHIGKVPQEKWDYRLIARLADIIATESSDEWYGSIFALAQKRQICGEISPQYCLLPNEGIEHILRLSPSVKIVFSLRDPIERNWSQIRMISSKKASGVDLMRIAELPDVVQRANYPALIARWSKYIPQDRMLILFMEDILAKPVELMSQVCKFLGVDFKKEMFRQLDKPAYVGKQLEMPPEVYGLLKDQLHPIYVEMSKLYPENAGQWLQRHY